LEDKSWEKIKGWLPNSYDWVGSMARKVKKKGRAREGMLIGKRKNRGQRR